MSESVDTEVRWSHAASDGCAVVTAHGRLDTSSYRRFTDDLVKFTVEGPRAVIVVIDDLHIASEALLTAFSRAWMRGEDWPAVPIMIVSESALVRECLHASAISRFIPVYAGVRDATAAVDDPRRRRTHLTVARRPSAGQDARRFVTEICERWSTPEVRVDAHLIVTEFVENACLHSRGDADLTVRLELYNGLFAIAVEDEDPREAILREPAADSTRRPGVHAIPRHLGLHTVSRLARRWGCSPRRPTGKVVWAVLPTHARPRQ
ncbi:hypothetical protein LTV02_12730 [Nocardia yamanashiensis]|uniref:ATP-binding protein n=1 Tax=Nocardia yamanashiensis TaxID=209247 RepID=UPI001E5C8720|nr:ATP-binding protein [Nocardia yamanashiensis]UGT44195.1 hypothetical protein LTV02_12730 [Nocardia yamanashiensis]